MNYLNPHTLSAMVVAVASLLVFLYSLINNRNPLWVRKAVLIASIAGLGNATLEFTAEHCSYSSKIAFRLSQGGSILAGIIVGIILTIYVSGYWKEHK